MPRHSSVTYRVPIVTCIGEISAELVLRERAWLRDGVRRDILSERRLDGAFADATLRIRNARARLVLRQGSSLALGTIGDGTGSRGAEIVRVYASLVLLTV